MLFFGLGVDFGTHLGLRHLEEAKQGKPFREALVAAMLGEGPSIVSSAICAALAFLAFVPTSYIGLAEFGIISALGMLVAVVVTFTVQPALMALMPPRPKPGRGVTIGIGGWIERRYRRPDRACRAGDRRGCLLSLGVQIDTNPLNLQNPEHRAGRDLSRSRARSRTSPYALDVMAPDLDTASELAPQTRCPAGSFGRSLDRGLRPEGSRRRRLLRSKLRRSGSARAFSPKNTGAAAERRRAARRPSRRSKASAAVDRRDTPPTIRSIPPLRPGQVACRCARAVRD